MNQSCEQEQQFRHKRTHAEDANYEMVPTWDAYSTYTTEIAIWDQIMPHNWFSTFLSCLRQLMLQAPQLKYFGSITCTRTKCFLTCVHKVLGYVRKKRQVDFNLFLVILWRLFIRCIIRWEIPRSLAIAFFLASFVVISCLNRTGYRVDTSWGAHAKVDFLAYFLRHIWGIRTAKSVELFQYKHWNFDSNRSQMFLRAGEIVVELAQAPMLLFAHLLHWNRERNIFFLLSLQFFLGFLVFLAFFLSLFQFSFCGWDTPLHNDANIHCILISFVLCISHEWMNDNDASGMIPG